MTDVIIIGAGVVGAAIARELSRKDRSVLVLEKNSDVCEGTSKANSGIVHGGYDAMPGTKKAFFNVKGSLMMEELSKTLDFPYKRNGSLVLLPDGADEETLDALFQRGLKNGVKGLEIIDRDRLHELEPNVNDSVRKALYVPTGALVCPFLLTIALAENAAVNGVEFRFDTEVTDIRKEDGAFRVFAGGEEYSSRYVINAAGVYADVIHNMVCPQKIAIRPVRGQYCLFDRTVGSVIKHTLFSLPTAMGKGVLVTPTVHGNLMAGPTAEAVDDREATNTTAVGLETVLQKGSLSVNSLPGRKVITSFAGLRAREKGGDFIIGEDRNVPGFIDVSGIESPGLSAAPAIGVHVAGLVNELDQRPDRKDFAETRKGTPSMANADEKTRQRLIKENPAFANVICRCELVTEGEIIDAIKRPLGARTLDGVKRRVRAGMGRCQAGFCSPKVAQILSRELGISEEEITKSGKGSEILKGIAKHDI
ncbi:MAG: NAD(P)/FAD-dependent oxidoreductase [Lachnospiraceae bacterium]|nr:NAD(P)/FAD-dependent oxidoreductase [Lachnospiraceae bacterium]